MVLSSKEELPLEQEAPERPSPRKLHSARIEKEALNSV